MSTVVSVLLSFLGSDGLVTVDHDKFNSIFIRRHGISGLSLVDGVGSIRLDETRVGSVIVDGSERPDWLAGGGGTDENGNSVGEFHSFN